MGRTYHPIFAQGKVCRFTYEGLKLFNSIVLKGSSVILVCSLPMRRLKLKTFMAGMIPAFCKQKRKRNCKH